MVEILCLNMIFSCCFSGMDDIYLAINNKTQSEPGGMTLSLCSSRRLEFSS